MTPAHILLVLLLSLSTSGCSYYITRPSPALPASTAEVRAEIARMKDNPVELPRPVVVIDGWIPVGGRAIKAEIARLTGEEPTHFELVSYAPGKSLEHIAEIVVRETEEHWPSDDAVWTTEVDVIGFSTGGVVARLAALPAQVDDGEPRKRLNIANLYSISAPHAGTVGISLSLAPDKAAKQMRPGSATLAWLDQMQPTVDYTMICYGQLNDQVVSAPHTAPEGTLPIWSYGRVLASHSQSARNRRILADIALRLREEPPIGVENVPLP